MNLPAHLVPVDRMAAKVVKKARPENIWMPQPKSADHIKHSKNYLAIVEIPESFFGGKDNYDPRGMRRGSLTVIGYAAEQKTSEGANWVVRCDCGNYEHRRRIFRWLGTHANDSCRECRHRAYLTKGQKTAKAPAIRDTLLAKEGEK